MSTPKRVQMTRHKPWRAEHPDAVVVARPTRWGNPFRVAGNTVVEPNPDPFEHYCQDGQAHGVAVRLFREYRDRPIYGYPSLEEIRSELGGRDLACWCPLDQPCHADVLLELANSGESR